MTARGGKSSMQVTDYRTGQSRRRGKPVVAAPKKAGSVNQVRLAMVALKMHASKDEAVATEACDS